MQRVPVESRNLVGVGYDNENNILEIEFKQRRVYRYRNVPQNIHEGLMNADSHGQYFHRYIEGRFIYDEQ